MSWKIVAEPKAANENDQNKGGIIVYMVNGHVRQEVSRVAFIRRESKNPDIAFADQLRTEVAKAKTAIAMVNGLLDESGELR